jgi:hypothetical protein
MSLTVNYFASEQKKNTFLDPKLKVEVEAQKLFFEKQTGS